MLVALISPSWPVMADSDGSFCIGPDYLAYEISFSIEPIGHRLYILRFDDSARWKDPSRIDLPEFNAGPMRCEHETIVLAGWDAIHYVTWREEARNTLRLRSEPKEPGPAEMREFPDTIGSLVFGIPGLPEEYSAPLPSDDLLYTYRLVLSRERDVLSPCTWNVRSYVAQYVFSDMVAEFELYAGQQPAECGE